MKTKAEINKALKRCDLAARRLKKWRSLGYRRMMKALCPKCWLGGHCYPEECTTKETLEWVLK